MYLGKVCIVTNCIGNRDVIKNGKNGFIIKTNDYKEIIEKINPENYNEISKNAEKDILTVFNTDRMVEEYKKEYRK